MKKLLYTLYFLVPLLFYNIVYAKIDSDRENTNDIKKALQIQAGELQHVKHENGELHKKVRKQKREIEELSTSGNDDSSLDSLGSSSSSRQIDDGNTNAILPQQSMVSVNNQGSPPLLSRSKIETDEDETITIPQNPNFYSTTLQVVDAIGSNIIEKDPIPAEPKTMLIQHHQPEEAIIVKPLITTVDLKQALLVEAILHELQDNILKKRNELLELDKLLSERQSKLVESEPKLDKLQKQYDDSESRMLLQLKKELIEATKQLLELELHNSALYRDPKNELLTADKDTQSESYDINKSFTLNHHSAQTDAHADTVSSATQTDAQTDTREVQVTLDLERSHELQNELIKKQKECEQLEQRRATKDANYRMVIADATKESKALRKSGVKYWELYVDAKGELASTKKELTEERDIEKDMIRAYTSYIQELREKVGKYEGHIFVTAVERGLKEREKLEHCTKQPSMFSKLTSWLELGDQQVKNSKSIFDARRLKSEQEELIKQFQEGLNKEQIGAFDNELLSLQRQIILRYASQGDSKTFDVIDVPKLKKASTVEEIHQDRVKIPIAKITAKGDIVDTERHTTYQALIDRDKSMKSYKLVTPSH